MLRRAALGGAPARPLAALLLLQLLLLSWAVASAGAAECLFPSLPTGAFHVVIAGWQRRPLQCFQHYLNEMGLTNARVFAYRRTEPHQPSFPPLRSSCGNVIEDRLLLPNHGREAAAFFDWVVEHYDSPPTSVVFLHGHGPHSWHTACQPVIARTRLAYTHYSDPDTADLIARHAVTLTWLDPAKNGPGQDIPRRAVNLSTEIAGYQSTKAAQACFAILAKVNLTVPERAPSCCASFVAAGERIRRYPKWFWRELRATALRPDIPDWIFGRLCFECAPRARRLALPSCLAPPHACIMPADQLYLARPLLPRDYWLMYC